MKTPHVGNQHPSNLLCAALGFHLDMVTFTQGARDTNFHPHLQIQDGASRSLTDPTLLTPFAQLTCGTSLEEYHQRAVRRVFNTATITTDVQLLQEEARLAETVLAASTAAVPRLWYRRVDAAGTLIREDLLEPYAKIADNIFRFSNQQAGWVVPNRISLVYTFIWQALSTGRDAVYALSGPDMVRYIGGLQSNLSQMYDAVRAQWPGLPEELHVYIVPVAQCRLVSHQRDKDGLGAVIDVLRWYYEQPAAERAQAVQSVAAVGVKCPQYTRPIERASFLSQYDLVASRDLYIPPWLLKAPLAQVANVVRLMSKARERA